VHQPLERFGAVDCRLSGLRLELANADRQSIRSARLAKRLVARNDKARVDLQRAENTSGRRRQRRLRSVTRVTTRLLGTIDRQTRRGQIADPVATLAHRLATEALDRLAPLTTPE
jgi:hypothetical protein